jgi:hypothetical protein
MDFAKWQTNFVHTKVVFDILSNNLLSLTKRFALLSLWLVDNLHKTSPFWVHAIDKQVPYLEYAFSFTSNFKYASSPHKKLVSSTFKSFFSLGNPK